MAAAARIVGLVAAACASVARMARSIHSAPSNFLQRGRSAFGAAICASVVIRQLEASFRPRARGVAYEVRFKVDARSTGSIPLHANDCRQSLSGEPSEATRSPPISHVAGHADASHRIVDAVTLRETPLWATPISSTIRKVGPTHDVTRRWRSDEASRYTRRNATTGASTDVSRGSASCDHAPPGTPRDPPEIARSRLQTHDGTHLAHWVRLMSTAMPRHQVGRFSSSKEIGHAAKHT